MAAKKKAEETVPDPNAETVANLAAAAGGSLIEALKPPGMSTRVTDLALLHYDFGCTPDGEVYGVPKDGPKIVRQLRGGRQSMRAELGRRAREEFKKVPSQGNLADAMNALEGEAQTAEPVPLHLRVAELDGEHLIDLGDQTGRCISITPTGWELLEVPPVLFRRTALTGALPVPVRGGDFSELWKAVNVADKYQPVLLAVLVSALMPDIAHPIMMITGEYGAAKTTTTKRIASILDPGTPQCRKMPRDEEEWVTGASGSYVVALDNLSGIPVWLSDALCRASTGDGAVRRQLFSDAGLAVFSFRRVVMINGIDIEAARGDLADRLVRVELDLIKGSARRRDEHLEKEWQAAHPKVLGALLDLAANVLKVLPEVHLPELPRMADFALVLAAVDRVLGTDGMSVYLSLRDDLNADVAQSDPVLRALTSAIREPFEGTAGDLLIRLDRHQGTLTNETLKVWPSNGRALSGRLTRLSPTMRGLGWFVEKHDKDRDPRRKQNIWELSPPPLQMPAGQPPNPFGPPPVVPQPVQPSAAQSGGEVR